MVYGDYDLLLPDSKELYVYTRSLENEKLLIVCNFSQEEQELYVPTEFLKEDAEILISNYDKVSVSAQEILRPYETFVLKVK